MIGLPVRSALAGFMPSTVAMILCYLFTTFTGLLLVEATLWFDAKVNLPTIVESTLGKKSKFVTLCLFLALFYSLFVAYLDGGGIIFAEVFSAIVGYSVPKTIGVVFCAVLVAAITYVGAHLANRLNQYLLLGLITSYALLMIIGLLHTSVPGTPALSVKNTINVIPMMLICFGYQNLVPSVTHYLQKNVKQIRCAIIIGNFLPLLVYVLWNYVILGILPADVAIHENTEIITQLLQNTVPIISIVVLVKSFTLFAMMTSFIPNAMSLVDFIKDATHKISNVKLKNDLVYIGIIFVPALAFTIIYQNLFLTMLDFAGGFVDVVLFGILPALVVLVGRKTISERPYQVFGGKITPMLIILISSVVLAIKVGVLHV